MDFVARAKALLQKQARTAALVIAPLAAAVSAQAVTSVPTLPTSSLSCAIGPTNCVTSAGVSALPSGANGVAGVKFYTNGALTLTGGGPASLVMSTFGTPGVNFSGSIPLSYDFTLNGPVSTWSLQFLILVSSGGGTYSSTVSGTGSGPFSGTSTLSNVRLTSNFFTTVQMIFTGTATDSFTIDIPQNSIDFNTLAAATPEPGTTALTGLGLALAAGWQLRRRNGFALVRKEEKEDKG